MTAVRAFFDGDMAKARDIHYKMAPINRACFLETNPGPVKTALAIMGKIPNGEMRLPMVPISQENEKALRNILAESKLI